MRRILPTRSLLPEHASTVLEPELGQEPVLRVGEVFAVGEVRPEDDGIDPDLVHNAANSNPYTYTA